MEARVQDLVAQVREVEARRSQLEAGMSLQLTESEQRLEKAAEEIETLNKSLVDRLSEYGQARETCEAALEVVNKQLAVAKTDIATLEKTILARDRDLDQHAERANAMASSLSWRLTAPFRQAGDAARRMGSSRRGLKVSAAWRHPMKPAKRKAYRMAKSRARSTVWAPSVASQSRFLLKIDAAVRHPLSRRARRAYRAEAIQKQDVIATGGAADASVAIVVHAFYPEIFEEILRLIRDLPARHKLFVTTIADHEARVRDALKALGRDFVLQVVANRGRDVMPFLRICPQIRAEGFEYLIKLHTKKSPQLKEGHEWRRDVLAKLISPDALCRALAAFADDPSLGVVCPDGYYLPISGYIGANENRVVSIGARLGLSKADTLRAGFFAGTMFMARVDTLAPLLNVAFADDEFETEAGQVDGTLAHALERCMGLGALVASKRIAVSSDLRARATFNPSFGFARRSTRTRGRGLSHLVPRLKEAGRRIERSIRHLIRGKKLISKAARGDKFDAGELRAWVAALRADPAVKQMASQRPLVSIVLPTRDRKDLLPRALKSVFAQTYSNWELIVVDDGSSDGTSEYLKAEYDDARLKVLTTSGIGVSGARNVGLQAVSGEFVAYIDSDNVWSRDYLELSLASIERSDTSSSYAVLAVLDAHNEVPWYRAMEFNRDKLKDKNFIDMNVFMHRASLIAEKGGFDTSLERMVDWDLIIRYTEDQPASFANFIGAFYDNSSRADRITNSASLAWLNVIRNKHLIDWQRLADDASTRRADLVSIIMCVYGQMDVTEACLRSLFSHEPGVDFELILVDNGSDAGTAKRLGAWASGEPRITLISNKENLNFALGNNIGFAASRGAQVVFLNNDTEVSPDWLRSLVRPLRDPAVKGTQPKLLFPDGLIQAVGTVFSSQSPMAYPIYVNERGDFEPTQKPRNYKALTAACLAMRAEDFVAARGFDPRFVNGQEDVDLCLRIGGGHPVFTYVPDSLVWHHESRTPGRRAKIEENRKVFAKRWNGKVASDDVAYYREDGSEIFDVEPDNKGWAKDGYAVWRPKRIVHPDQGRAQPALEKVLGRTVAIKIGCPNRSLKERWGDYHFAVALAAAFMRRGVRARVDFLDSWSSGAKGDDINLVLRGLSEFKPVPGALNFMWLISHPDKASIDEMRAFDHVFIASDIWSNLAASKGVSCEPLLQCTDAS